MPRFSRVLRRGSAKAGFVAAFTALKKFIIPTEWKMQFQACAASLKHVASEEQFAWKVIVHTLITRTGSVLISGYVWRVCVVTDNTQVDECFGRYDDVWEA